MDVDLPSLHKILKDSTRRNIILNLSKKGPLPYIELMNLLEITNTGKFNYHLKVLGNLVEKGENGKYHLTDRGQLAVQLLQKFPEKRLETRRLGVGDAILIGIVGFLLILAFPLVFLLGVVVRLLFLVTLYELFVPGAVMWWLTVRRIKNHDIYDLLKPCIAPLTLVIALIILTLLLHVSFRIQVSQNGNYAQFLGIGYIALGFFPCIGVLITESLFRMSKHL